MIQNHNNTMEDMSSISRAELVSTLAKLIFMGALSYYTLKRMLDVLDPTKKQKKEAQRRAEVLMSRLNLTQFNGSLNDYELMVASQLIDPQSIDVSWGNIGGLDGIIDDIKSEVILPMKMPEMFSNCPNHRPPTGVLLHGPPGCGKTMLAKATAREAGARFINLEVAMLTDKWYGESQKLAKAVFTLAKKIQPCIIFIDEIDSFLRSRGSNDHEATAMIKAQFMTLWDGIETDESCHVIIMGATNRPHDVDRAILRRMPAMYSIGLPNTNKRKAILTAMIDHNALSPSVDLDRIAELTEDYSGSDLRELYRAASMMRVKEYAKYHPELFGFHPDSSSPSSSASSIENYSLLNGGNNDHLRQIEMEDFLTVHHKMLESKRVLNLNSGTSVIGID